MKKVRLDFCDFHENYSKTNNFFYKLLKERFEVELCDQPDFLIYSCYGHEHRLHSGVRIFFSGESDMPDFRECDYSLASVKLDDSRHLRFPNYLHNYGEAWEIIKKNDDPEKILASKTKFCSFVVSGYSKKNKNRVVFFEKLS